MAINAAPQYVRRKRRRLWPWSAAPVFDAPIHNVGFARIAINPNQSIALASATSGGSPVVPPSADRLKVVVEAYPIRYLDGATAAEPGYGELYPAGSFFFAAVDPNFVTLAADSTNAGIAIVNISFYATTGPD